MKSNYEDKKTLQSVKIHREGFRRCDNTKITNILYFLNIIQN